MSMEERMTAQEVALKAHLEYCIRNGDQVHAKIDALRESFSGLYKWMVGGMGAVLLLLLANLITKLH